MDNPQKQDTSSRKRTRELDRNQLVRHIAFAIVVGIACGLASVVLCLCVGWAYAAFASFPWLVWTLPVMGVLQIIVYKHLGLDADLTTRSIVHKMRNNEKISYSLAPGILLTTCMSIFSGGSVGKEAGALQIGASLGSLISKPFNIKPIFHKPDASTENAPPMNNYAASCGMAACFAALFFAPLGSFMFVLELTHFRRPTYHHGLTMLLACFVAYFVASLFGIGDIISKVSIPDINWMIVGQCIVIGVAAAFVGSIFDFLIKTVQNMTQAITRNYYIWVVVGGLLFAILVTIFGWDNFTGTGDENLNMALKGNFGAWDFLIKALLTLICLGLWFKGGEIMPSLCIGGLLGASCTFMTNGSPIFGAAIGVLAFFSAFSRCPLAAFLMGCEIFGWGIAPFSAIAIFVSYMFSYPVGMYGNGLDKVILKHMKKGSRQKTIEDDV